MKELFQDQFKELSQKLKLFLLIISKKITEKDLD